MYFCLYLERSVYKEPYVDIGDECGYSSIFGTYLDEQNEWDYLKNTSDWQDIQQVVLMRGNVLGLTEYGAVLSEGSDPGITSQWTDIVYLYESDGDAFGIKKDGTIVSCGNFYGTAFKNFDLINSVRIPRVPAIKIDHNAVTETAVSVEESSETQTEEITEKKAPEINENYKQIYKDMLSEYLGQEKSDEDPDKVMFDLIDLTNDGMDELLLSDGDFVSIYTVSDDKLAQLICGTAGNGMKDFGTSGITCIADNGWIREESPFDVSFFHVGDYAELSSPEIYDKDDKWYIPNAITLELDYIVYSYDGNEMYCLNGGEISKEDFLKETKQYTEMNWHDAGRAYDINEETLEKLFG